MIKVERIKKSYGKKNVLHDFNLNVDKGSILGLLGPNGSGKSTLLHILAGTLYMDSGNVKIDDFDIGTDTKAFVSLLPEENQFYEWMRIKDAEEFFMVNFNDFEIDKYNSLKSKMDFDDMKLISKMSKGELQQFRVAIALSRRAKVYLLDEPLGAIDTLARQNIVSLIFDTMNENSCMIIATHLINETERLFDNVLFIKKGEVVLFDECDKLRQAHKSSIENIYKDVMQNA